MHVLVLAHLGENAHQRREHDFLVRERDERVPVAASRDVFPCDKAQRMARIAYRTIDSEVGGAPPARLRAGM